MNKMKGASPRDHIPVLSNEVLFCLNPKDDAYYLDATFGCGGHSSAILSAANCKIIAIDRDDCVVKYANEMKEFFGDRLHFACDRFSNAHNVCEKIGIKQISGAIIDAGVSSIQIDQPDRGFSFNKDGPLLMTMGKNTITAYDIINHYAPTDISKILLEYGDEMEHRNIVHAICEARSRAKIKSTKVLADIIRKVVSKWRLGQKIHPATKTFQALRIAVNDELEELYHGIVNIAKLLEVGGVFAVITFHSTETRVVKHAMSMLIKQNDYSTATDIVMDDTNINNTNITFRMLQKKAIQPSCSEIHSNIRARSATMRVMIRMT